VIIKKRRGEGFLPQGLSEASNSAGMRREKNPKGFFDMQNPERVEARRGNEVSSIFSIFSLIRRGGAPSAAASIIVFLNTFEKCPEGK